MSLLPTQTQLRPTFFNLTGPASIPIDPAFPPIRRLVVLIPDAETQEAELAQQLWTIAARGKLTVLLFGLRRNAGSVLSARRRLATLAALIAGPAVQVETRLAPDADWLPPLRRLRCSGDLVICHAEQRLARWGIWPNPVGEWLAGKLNAPVGVLAGFYPRLPPDHFHPASRFIAGAAPFIIFFSATALQILIHQTTWGWLSSLLLSASVVVEYGLIGIWYVYFS